VARYSQFVSNVVGPVPGPATTIASAPTKTLVCTQTFTLNSTNWNFVNSGMGVLGNINMAVAGNNALEWTATIQKGATGTPIALNGTFYYTSSAYFFAPVNGVSLISESPDVWLGFSNGDTAIVKLYASYIGSSGTGPTVEIAPAGASFIISSVNI
jgi:hypothetical protein